MNNSQIKVNKINLIIFILISLSFLIGFILNEDSSGGGALDFKHEIVSINEFKNGIFSALTSIKYESSRMPLFLIINAFNPFSDNIQNIRISNFIFNILICIFFLICLLKQKKINNNLVLIVGSLLLLSPYFRTSSYWAHQENLPFLFMFMSMIFFHKKFQIENFIIEKNFLNIFFIASLSSLSFYSDQKFIFLSLFFYLYFIFYRLNLKNFLVISLIFFLTSIPALYLFYLWQGILPIESQFRIGFYPKNISASISIVSFYFAPLIYLFFKKKIFTDLTVSKLDIFIGIMLLTLNFVFMPNFNDPWGNGVIVKLMYVFYEILNFNILFIKLFYFLLISVSSYLIYLMLKKEPLNFLPLVIIIFFTSLIERTYNEYFDPLIIVLIFTYFSFSKKLGVYSKENCYNYLIFSIFFLFFSNIYYTKFNLVQ